MSHAPRILVVDDEEVVRNVAARALREVGCEVAVAADGAEALRQIEQQPAFDLYVLDLMMPLMSGDELAQQVRQRYPDAKILYFTGFSDRLFREKTTLWQNEAFIEKPVTMNGLREAVSLLLFGHLHGLRRESQP